MTKAEYVRRPTARQATKAIREFLQEELGHVPGYTKTRDGSSGWAFWICVDDTTSYVHHDLKIEWYGTGEEDADG